MRPILKFIFALFIFATVNNVSAQSIRVTNGTRPIQLGDSVLVAVGWDNQPINEFYNVRAIEKIEFKGLIELTKEDLKKQRFAFFIYPTATRIIDPTFYNNITGKAESEYGRSEFSKKLYTIIVLDKDGKEIRDSLSNTRNAQVRIRKVEIAGPEEKSWELASLELHVTTPQQLEYLEQLKNEEKQKNKQNDKSKISK